MSADPSTINTKLHVQMFFCIDPNMVTFLVNEKLKELFYVFCLD